MNRIEEEIKVVALPEYAKVTREDGTQGVKGNWVLKTADEIRMERRLLLRRQQLAAFPLEVVKPDTVRYRKPDGQPVEFKLSRLPFQLLEFIIGQEGMSEHLSNIAAAFWQKGTADKTDSINQAKVKVNQELAKHEIPFLLRRKNGCIALVKGCIAPVVEKN